MAQNYTRQSTLSDGDTITASLFNDEYNQLVNAFTYSSTSASSTGHRHDGSAGQGGNIFKIGDLDFLNKIEVDSTNNRWGFYVEVSSAAVEQIRIQDGSIVPVTTNDIDLGTASLQFKDLYIDGTANVDSLTLTSGSTVTTILDEDDLSSDSATALVTQQSVKAYIDAQVTAQDLDFQADSGGALSIDLDSETMTFTGGTGITTTGLANDVTFAIDSTVTTLTGTQTLTNKTLTTPVISSISNTGTLTLPTSTDTLVGRATTDTLTNKTLTSPDINTPDIDGGTIDGATIATSDITVGTGKTLDVSSGTLTLADDQISGDKVEGGTIASTTITSLASTTVDTTNLEVTNIKAKDGTSAGSIADSTGVVTLASSVLTTTDINGGTIDGTTIGGSTAAAGSFTTVSATGNITVGGTVDGRDVATDGTKLDGIEASADVTDTANVTAAGAVMDSELTSEASVKALNQGVATTDSPTFAGVTVNGTVEFDGLSGTGAVSVTDILDQDDMSSNSATALATQQSIKAYVDSQVATVDTLSEILANGNTTGGTDLSVSSGDDVKFADDSKALFGAGNDLKIYHSANNQSYIHEAGTGDLNILASNFKVQNGAGTENKIVANTDGAVSLYYDNTARLATTSTGIDVTGTAVTDGVTVDGVLGFVANASFPTTGLVLYTNNYLYQRGGSSGIIFSDASGTNEISRFTPATVTFNEDSNDQDFRVESDDNANMLFVDAGNNRIGVGTNAPSHQLTVSDTGTTQVKVINTTNSAELRLGSSSVDAVGFVGTSSNHDVSLISNNSTRMTIDADGNVGINDTTPENMLTVVDTDGGSGIAVVKARTPTTNGRASYQIGNDAANWFMGVDGGNSDSFFIANAVGSSDKLVIDSSGNTTQTNTGAGSAAGPYLTLDRNSASPADSDLLGVLSFRGRDDGANATDYGTIAGKIADVTGGTEDGVMLFNVISSGSSRDVLTLSHNESVFNNGSADQDFRVESDGASHMLFVDAGNNRVGIGESSPDTPLHITTSASGDVLTVESVSDGALHGPNIVLHRNSGSPADDDMLGRINFNADDSAGSNITYAQILSQAKDVTAGTVDARLKLGGLQGSTFVNYLDNQPTESVFNEDSVDRDFRVESDSNTHALFLQGSNGFIGLGESSPQGEIHIRAATPSIYLQSNDGEANDIIFGDASDQSRGRIRYDSSENMIFQVNNLQERLKLGFDNVTVNEGSYDVDFRVESNNNANAIFLDAGNDRLYIDAEVYHDSDSGSQRLYITRSGATNQSGSMYADDNTFVFDSTQDEASGANFLFRATNASISNMSYLELDYAGGSTFNQGGESFQDFRVESNSDTHMLFVDAGNNRVGIGDSAPDVALSVVTGQSNEQFYLQSPTPGMKFIDSNATSRCFTIGGENGSVAIHADPNTASVDSHILMKADGSTIARFDGDGLKFGTDTAAANGLDDFETGGFDPRYSAATGGEIGGSQVSDGKYTKIGNLVIIEFSLYISGIDVTGKSGAVTITGLPFSSQSAYGPSSLRTTNNTSVFGAFTNAPETVGAQGSSLFLNKARSGNVEQALDVTDFATGAGNRNIIYVRHVYRAA